MAIAATVSWTTAGIRRKGKTTLVAEKLSVVMARRGLERCDVALLVVDGEQGVTQGDAQIASYAEESGRSVVIVINKWDLAVVAARAAASRDAATTKGKARRAPGERHKPENFDPGRLMFDYEKNDSRQIEISQLRADRFSVRENRRAHRQTIPADQSMLGSPPAPNFHAGAQQLAQGRSGFAARHHSPARAPCAFITSRRRKSARRHFLVFTNQKAPLHFSYERFLENQLRGKFDFVGTPIRFIQRLRKRDDKSERDEKSSRGDKSSRRGKSRRGDKSSRGGKSSRTDESSRGDK